MKLIRLLSSPRGYGRFKCSCGKLFSTYIYNVRSGHTKSCGCLLRSKKKSKHPLYGYWRNMKCRVRYPYYKRWAGRGIQAFEPWCKSFERFVQDVGLPPKGVYSLDRIDNDGGYFPGNVRWATQKQQCNNQSRNRHVVFKGQRMTLQQAANMAGLKSNTVLCRLRRGWSEGDSLTKKLANTWQNRRKYK